MLNDCDAIKDSDLKMFYKQELKNKVYQQNRAFNNKTHTNRHIIPSPKNNLDRACCAILADLMVNQHWLDDAVEVLGQIAFANNKIDTIRLNVVKMIVDGIDKNKTKEYIDQSLSELEIWQSDCFMPNVFLQSATKSFDNWKQNCLKHSILSRRRLPIINLK